MIKTNTVGQQEEIFKIFKVAPRLAYKKYDTIHKACKQMLSACGVALIKDSFFFIKHYLTKKNAKGTSPNQWFYLAHTLCNNANPY